MKILIANDCGRSAHYWQRVGLARVLEASGHQALIWNTDRKSTYDAFDEFEPDLFIGQTYNINRAYLKCFEERPAMKVILKAADSSPMAKEISKKYPILIAKDGEIDTISKINNLEYVFIHYPEKFLERTHKDWIASGVKVVSDLNAADLFEYCNGKSKDIYKCDIGYVGGSWEYKAKTLNPYLLSMCSNFDYKIKIFGRGWNCPQACGYLENGEEKHFYKSAKINLCIHEAHSQEYGYDITEKFFKLAINKSFVISDSVTGLKEIFNKGTYINNPAELKHLCSEILSDYSNYSTFIQNAIDNNYKTCITKHTYFDRAYKTFELLNLQEEANHILDTKQKIINQIGGV